MMLLESPYPKDEVVVILNQSTQMVDDTLRPVPLSEVSHSIRAFTCQHWCLPLCWPSVWQKQQLCLA